MHKFSTAVGQNLLLLGIPSVWYGLPELMPGHGVGWYPGSERVTLQSPITRPAYPAPSVDCHSHDNINHHDYHPPPHHLSNATQWCKDMEWDRLGGEMTQNSMLFHMYFDFLAILSWYFAILGVFSRVMTRLEAPGIQEDTAGVVYGSHPSKTVCYFTFISNFWYFILIFRDFKRFFMRYDAFGSSRDTRGHRRDGLWQPSFQMVCYFAFNSIFWPFYPDISRF